MFAKLADRDPVLNGSSFLEDEIRFNLLHLICGSPDALRIKNCSNELIFAQTPGFNPWLWIAPGLSEEREDELLRKLAEHVRSQDFPGISADYGIAESFARYYTESRGLKHEPYMMLEAYACPEVKPPAGVGGVIERANSRHTEMIAAYLAAFSKEAFNFTPQPNEVYKAATAAIGTGGLYLWQEGGETVSIARIAHRTARHARINDVYTVPGARKKGYASAIVAALSDYCLRDGLTPMLYADAKNPDSNKVYQSIGFVGAGRISDVRFKQ
ncbi:GNAT family N-acetyltransferase [Paenibacillus rhizophilus]|uniref:GNAT family N-acetyltransferase n=1 Tax=Paenibacillus rhizophilus TaxID=1850366 RepID=A0A3N9Q5S9_9BACL|nr:GNAT family N-acetyltransferase [Paenibacillus rhizophilus]RQW12866.1 GNAT family N-acetyltransferase [Paenibacillus rhizophilus]